MSGTKKLSKAVSIVSKKKPPLQRSKVSGLRTDKLCDIICIDHADVEIRSETYTVFIVVYGATAFVTAFAPRTKGSHATVRCLMEWMDTFHCNRRVFVWIWFPVP